MDRYRTGLGATLLVVGVLQVAFAITRSQPSWTLFYVLFGASLAAIGAATLWTARGTDDA